MNYPDIILILVALIILLSTIRRHTFVIPLTSLKYKRISKILVIHTNIIILGLVLLLIGTTKRENLILFGFLVFLLYVLYMPYVLKFNYRKLKKDIQNYVSFE